MYCMKCNNDIINCTCPDVEERLKSLMKNPIVSPAAEQNLRARIEAKLKPTRSNELEMVLPLLAKEPQLLLKVSVSQGFTRRRERF